MKQIDRLLFFQGNRCFFCDHDIPEGEASVEHLVPTSLDGGNDDDNCVVCCKTLNLALGNRPVKEKS
jgi:5-methylcytosine-specific restriction endonuclease McrA